MIHEILCSIVFKYLTFYSKHVFRRISKIMRSIDIVDLKNIDYKYLRKIDNEILQNYTRVKMLNASYNIYINNINNLTSLKELITHGNMRDDDISGLNLEILNANSAYKIKNVNHMSKLRKLSATYECGIDNKGIECINLHEIDVSNNVKIDKNNLKHMTELKNIIDDYDDYYFMSSKWKY